MDTAYNEAFNGFRLITARSDNTAWLWDFDPDVIENLLDTSKNELEEAFTDEQCKLYFRDDLAACPTTKEGLFSP